MSSPTIGSPRFFAVALKSTLSRRDPLISGGPLLDFRCFLNHRSTVAGDGAFNFKLPVLLSLGNKAL